MSNMYINNGNEAGAIRQAHYEDRVATLKIEIAKATDPQVKTQLEQVLQDLVDKHQQQTNRARILFAIIIIVFILIAIAFLGMYFRSMH